MKTEYDLYHWSRDGAVICDRDVRRFPTLADAMFSTGFGSPEDWYIPPAGGWGLRRDLAEKLGYVKGQPWAISEELVAETDAERVKLALKVALDFGQIDGDHHKAWVIDQMVRHLAGSMYETLIRNYCRGDDGPDTYTWDTGVAP